MAHFSPSGHDDGGELAEINVTPLVDVMLVLLIIFIITAPMLVEGLKVELPKANANPLPAADVEDMVVISLTEDQLIYIGDMPVALELLPERLAGLKGPVYVKGDHRLPYGFVVKVLAALDQAGIAQVGMVTSPEGT